MAPNEIKCDSSVGQVMLSIFLNTPPQNLSMVDLVRVDAKKIDLEASNQILYGLKAYLVSTTTV